MNAEAITSAANPLLKEVRRAVAHGGLTREGYCIAETPHLLEEAVRSGCEIAAVLLAGDVQFGAVPPGARVIRLPEALFAAVAATEAPQGVLALVRPPEWSAADILRGTPLVAVLDGVQEPGNAGAILRSAEAFGATGAVFVKGSANPYNPKAVRASAGSVFRLPLLAGVPPEEVHTLLAGATVYAAAPEATIAVSAADLTAPCAIVIGSEGRGVSAAMRAGAMLVRIPTSGVESLNAAVAAAVLLYEASRQRSRG
ncbi:MAG TPA: RNA methyltransferase [Bryobacteraceae bacterium]|nr:RNA methyltransferase [Bryobacteraceae bacterium]